MLKRIGLWQNFRKYKHKCRHGRGRINDTAFTKKLDHDRRCQGRCQNVDKVVTQQNGTDQPLLILAQPVDDPCPLISILFLVMHDWL